jgi:trk system potassium uptake protein TrkA
LASNGQTILVIGLGRFGYALAKELRDTSRDIMVVDSNSAIVTKYANEFERIAEADCTNSESLAQLGIEDFHSVVIAIGGDQEASILTTALVADFGVENIWAKAMTPQHAKILKRIGAHHVVQPEREMGVRVAHLVSQKTREYLEIGDDWVLVKTSPLADITGKPLSDTQLRRKLKVTIVSYKPQHSNEYRPADGSTVLTYGDEIVVVGASADVDDYLAQLGN